MVLLKQIIKKKIFIAIVWLMVPASAVSQVPESIIVLDPAGDARTIGRSLKNSYERGATLQLAEKLQQHLAAPATTCIISRRPGQIVKPLDVASFANRLQATSVINIQMYHCLSAKPVVHIYHLSYHPFVELNHNKKITELSFIPVRKAHTINMQQTQKFAQHLHKQLRQAWTNIIEVRSPAAIPLKPLVGFVCPAITIEIGINEESKISGIIQPLADAIKKSVRLISN